MKASEVRQLGDAELITRLDETYEELRNLRFQHATRQLQNTARFGQLRRDVARIKTIMRERELAGGTTE
ncbi:MAG TPA: 50S ribosomal protein L29 [Chloroflexota bacterium]|jgi:large subunit ribosomal protein L29|nr:50S ribosomal protein L29 [Chloroflexota bacterium]